MNCDILNLEWSSSGRDREAATLICNVLRRKGYKVIEASVFNYRYYLMKYRPRLLYAADPKGASINYQAVKFAHQLGVPVVTLTAEGNYTPEAIETMFWGHISDRELLEKLNLQWSSRARNLVLKLDASLASQVKVAGGVGFDRYHIYQFYKKEDWMRKYYLNHRHMVGYASWGFDSCYRDNEASQMEGLYGKEQVELFRQERLQVNEILRELIERNEDTLFLLKEHPGVTDPSKTELVGLKHYPNVLYTKNEEAIADCLSGCDIWMAFESTTCLEAWLLDKPTILINPLSQNPIRSSVHKGCVILRNYEAVQECLTMYFESGSIPKFKAKGNTRRRILEETIQWTDGKNHLRAAYWFEKALAESPRSNMHIGIRDMLKAFWQNTLFQGARYLPFLPKFRAYAPARQRFRRSELEELTRRYKPYLEAFDQANPLTEQDIEELERINR